MTLAAAISAGIFYATAQSPEEPAATAQTETTAEGETLSPSEIALNAMTEEYKILKELQYEGEEDSAVYPQVMNMYLTATKAL